MARVLPHVATPARLAARSPLQGLTPAILRLQLAWLFLASGCVWGVPLLLRTTGVTTHDAIAHFIISREAWHRPELLLHHWGRPLGTLLYMPSGLYGLVYARLTSLLLSAATVWLAFQLAQHLEIEYAFVAPVLIWFQPWFLQLSVHPPLTELPFSLMMVGTALLFLSKRLTPASMVIGLMPLIRHEAIALVGLWVVVCAARRRWRDVVVSLVPILGYAILYRQVFGHAPGGEFPIVPHLNTFVLGQPHRDLLYFPKLLARGVGLPVACLALYGLPRAARSRERLAIFAWYGIYMAIHVVLYRIGYPEEGGEQRYLFPLAPIIAVAAAIGLGMLRDEVCVTLYRMLPIKISRSAVDAALLTACLGMVFASGSRITPVSLDAEGVAAREVGVWLSQQRLAGAPIVATHVYVHYFLPGHLFAARAGGNPEALWYDPPPLSSMAPGTLAVWDSHYSNNYGLPYAALSSQGSGWVLLKRVTRDRATMVVFRKEARQR